MSSKWIRWQPWLNSSQWRLALAIGALTSGVGSAQEPATPQPITPAPVVQARVAQPPASAAPVIRMDDPRLKDLLQMRTPKANPQNSGITLADVPSTPLRQPALEIANQGDAAEPQEPAQVVLPSDAVPIDSFAPAGLPWPVAGMTVDNPALASDSPRRDDEPQAGQEPQELQEPDATSSTLDPPLDPTELEVGGAVEAPSTSGQPLESQAAAIGDPGRPASGEPVLRATPPMGRITDVDVHNPRTAAFSGVTPGETTVAQMLELLGEPAARGDQADKPASYIYRIGPFPKVECLVQDNNVVSSVLVSLKDPAGAEEVAAELQIGQFRSAAIFDEHGELMGYVFPERGIILNLDDAQQNVTQIMIEPIRAEFFVIRARNDSEQRYRLNLADLNYALQLDPTSAEAYWLKSQIFTELGRFKDALQLAEYAVERAPDDHYYKLQQAKLIALNGDFHRAEMIVDRILSENKAPEVVLARAHCLMGDLVASGPQHDFEAATEHHRAAIAVAAPFWTDRRTGVSRMAIQVLIDANLAVANDIAWGRWSKKAEVIPQWLATASKVIEAQAGNHHLDSLLTLQMHRRSLMAYAGTAEESKYREIAAAAQKEADDLLASSDDWLFKSRVQWELGEALYQSMRCALKDGNQEMALEYAERAVELVELSDNVRQVTTHQEFVYGQLYYLTGSIYALAHEDHQEAIRWYRKAAPYLTTPYPRDVVPNSGILGDQIVSIGVSYWNTDNQQDAIAMTKAGVQLIRKGIADGQRDESALAIPYGNLATMYRLLGDQDEAKSYETLVSRIQKASIAKTPAEATRH